MKKTVVIFIMAILCVHMGYAEQKDFEMTLENNPTPTANKGVRLQIEAQDKDLSAYGLSRSQLYNEIASRLSLAQIAIMNGPKDPLLLLRIRTIETNRVVATFVQMSFFEEATLVRNQSAILALTWSQASMIACEAPEWPKQVTDSVVSMVNDFILSYNKVFSGTKEKAVQAPTIRTTEKKENAGYGP